MEIKIKKLTPQDVRQFSKLLTVFAAVFETKQPVMTDEDYLENLLKNERFIVLAAIVETGVVGGLTVHVLPSYSCKKPAAYIYDVGVLPAYQRKGVGKKLIAYLKNYCIENEFAEAFVQADTEDAEAIEFYRATGFTSEMHVLQFTQSFSSSLADVNKESAV